MESKKQFFLECYELGIIKFGRFTLKSGIESPFYVDLRPLASDPKILKRLANYLLDMLPLDNFDLICGVPYAALPMATAMSLESYLPLIIKRKEAKDYGTKKMIEGISEIIPDFVGLASWNVSNFFPVLLKFFEQWNHNFPIF